RYLRSKSRTGFLSVITYLSVGGVTVGVAALCIVLSVMNGFETEVRGRILGVDAHLRLTSINNAGIPLDSDMITLVRQTAHVTGVSPYVFEKGMIRVGEDAEGILLRGTDPQTIGEVSDLPQNICAGSLDFHSAELPGLVLGKFLADRLGAIVGDTAVIFSPAGMTSPFSAPVVRQFVVVGLFQTGLFEFDDLVGYLDITEARKTFLRDDKIDGLEIRLDNLWNAADVKQALEDKIQLPYYVRTWFELRRTLFSWMQIEKWMWFIVLSLIIIVAAFNILSTLIMVSMEKRRDIGILKAMGSQRGAIARIFSYQGLLVGVVGAALGLFLGWLLCFLQLHYKFVSLPSDLYFLDALPVKMQPLDFLLVALAAILLSYLGATYPARQAAKLSPVDAIRDTG
ncbi:ABC transporter permease, partial [bacterium]|nr:ABC transporter permease [bacterium]